MKVKSSQVFMEIKYRNNWECVCLLLILTDSVFKMKFKWSSINLEWKSMKFFLMILIKKQYCGGSLNNCWCLF